MTMSGMKKKPNFGGGAMENDDEYADFKREAAKRSAAAITVTISGPVGVGKSAIAARIYDALAGQQIGITCSAELDRHRGEAITSDVRIIERVTYPAPKSIFSPRYKRYAAWPVVLWCRLRGHAGQPSWGGTNRCLQCGDAR